jgi:hypothetical protein
MVDLVSSTTAKADDTSVTDESSVNIVAFIVGFIGVVTFFGSYSAFIYYRTHRNQELNSSETSCDNLGGEIKKNEMQR